MIPFLGKTTQPFRPGPGIARPATKIQLALHGAVDGHAVTPGGAAAVFEVEDLDRATALLEGRGVAFDHQGDVQGYARFASFHDPDGNALQLIEYARQA